jgi:hypothetical protein
MQVPPILKGQSLKRLLQGVAIGAVMTMTIGFYWAGWKLGSTAMEMAQKSSSAAVVAVLAPICVDKFQHATDSSSTLVELKKISSWQQASFVEKGGWASFPGSATVDSAVARACGEMLAQLK